MDFLLRLVVMPLGIAILSIIGVYTLGVTGAFIFAVVISLYYSFGLNAVRTYSPNGHTSKISPSKIREYMFISFGLSISGLYALHLIFSYFKN